MTESSHDDEPEASAERSGSSGADPRMARFGEGPEGRAARAERGLPDRPREGFFGRVGKFVHDTRAELRRVSWPSALEVRNTTIITIIAVIFFAVYLFAVDRAFSFVIEQLQRLVGAA
jgi:preprotein translocase subunit SecE